MLPQDIPVSTRKHIETHRETISPRSQDEVGDIIASVLSISRAAKVTGKIQVNLVQGGVRSIGVDSTQERTEK